MLNVILSESSPNQRCWRLVKTSLLLLVSWPDSYSEQLLSTDPPFCYAFAKCWWCGCPDRLTGWRLTVCAAMMWLDFNVISPWLQLKLEWAVSVSPWGSWCTQGRSFGNLFCEVNMSWPALMHSLLWQQILFPKKQEIILGLHKYPPQLWSTRWLGTPFTGVLALQASPEPLKQSYLLSNKIQRDSLGLGTACWRSVCP